MLNSTRHWIIPTYIIIHNIHRVSKKLCQLIFCSLSVKYEPISKKLVGVSRNTPLTKLCLKCPLHVKHLLELPWENWSARLSRQRNNEVHIWMINWIVTFITGSYCLLSLKKSLVSHHIVFISYSVSSKCLPPARAQACGRWCHYPRAHSITVWLRAAQSLLTRRFSSSVSEILVR